MLGQTTETIHLDVGWGPHGRSAGGSEPYSDLKNRIEDVLILELAYGEPGVCQDGSFDRWARPGATRNPRAWVDVLEAEGRRVISILLSDNWRRVEERLRSRRGEDPIQQKQLFDLYETEEWRNFSTAARITEESIQVDGMNPIEVASEVLRRLVCLGIPLRILSAAWPT
jgi:hypothetical protein